MLENLTTKLRKIIERSLLCTGCGICIVRCPQHAIYMEDGHARVSEGCVSCGACLESCPIISYQDITHDLSLDPSTK
ncbi:MAG: 4Fe-4S binding protein [Methermicoccaceae archaeon]